MHLLLVEDDVRLARVVAQLLQEVGHAVDVASALSSARSLLQLGGFDGLVLDRVLPDGDGLELCRERRASGDLVPVLVLSGRGDVPEVVDGLACGADDYLRKPFTPAELRARVTALLRRGPAPRLPVISAGALEIDRTRRGVTQEGVGIPLTAKEFALVEALADPPGRLVGRLELLERCWDHAETPGSNVIDVHIRALRRKLGEDAIVTQRGTGYRLATD